jgi:hypothetical protein
VPNSLKAIMDWADHFRFVHDILSDVDPILGVSGRLKDNFLKDGLEISEKTLPIIGRRFATVCDRLNIPRDAISAFVYASAEVQAECYGAGLNSCIVRFSSALLELLDEDEFAFVAGHEIGHFLLRHKSTNAQSANLSSLRKSRAQEVSADRLGLLTCGSIEVAMRAMMKTASGLSSKHLAFNVSEYIRQLNKLSDNSSAEIFRTHPSVVLRSRALLWFSMLDRSRFNSTAFYEDVQKIDGRIAGELFADVDRILSHQIQSSKNDLKIWFAALRIVESGSFSKTDQNLLTAEFDIETVKSLKCFLQELSPAEALYLVKDRISETKFRLQELLPDCYEDMVGQMKIRAESIIKAS